MARANASITVFFRREGEQILAYSPALELATCGKTLPQAKQMFEKALDTFFDALEEMGTTEKALKELGWRRVSTPAQPWRPPVVRAPVHLLARREMHVALPR